MSPTQKLTQKQDAGCPADPHTKVYLCASHCNGAEGTHDFGDLLQIQAHSSGRRRNHASTGTHSTLETNKHDRELRSF